MATTVIQSPPRPPIDCIAEGMWRIACGESCVEPWALLPEQQKEWWHDCATELVRRWKTGEMCSCY
jgi:hypothetical protein